MQHRALIVRTGAGIAVASMLASPLAGCSGSTSALTPPVAQASVTRSVPSATASDVQVDAKGKKKAELLFVSDNENSKILVFDVTKKKNPPVVRTITSGISSPNGIATDESGNLYVANSYSGTITVYAPNSSTPKTTISSGLSDPFDVKVDAAGNIFVANDPIYGGTSYINEYPSGSSSPSKTWYAPQSGMTISGLALLDPKQPSEESIYALGFSINQSSYANGVALSCYPGNYTCVELSNTFGQTGGIAVAESPGLSKPFQWLAVDQYIPGVDIFTEGGSTQQLVTGGTPEFTTLNAKDNELFVADEFYGRVYEYSYPGLKEVNSFSSGGATYGVATYPSGTFH